MELTDRLPVLVRSWRQSGRKVLGVCFLTQPFDRSGERCVLYRVVYRYKDGTDCFLEDLGPTDPKFFVSVTRRAKTAERDDAIGAIKRMGFEEPVVVKAEVPAHRRLRKANAEKDFFQPIEGLFPRGPKLEGPPKGG